MLRSVTSHRYQHKHKPYVRVLFVDQADTPLIRHASTSLHYTELICHQGQQQRPLPPRLGVLLRGVPVLAATAAHEAARRSVAGLPHGVRLRRFMLLRVKARHDNAWAWPRPCPLRNRCTSAFGMSSCRLECHMYEGDQLILWHNI